MNRRTALPLLNLSDDMLKCIVNPNIINKIVFLNNNNWLSSGNNGFGYALHVGYADCVVGRIEVLSDTFDACIGGGEAVLSEN